MSEMVERVARRLVRKQAYGTMLDDELERHVDEHWHLKTDEAREIIEAMREPTQAMILAGEETFTYAGIPGALMLEDADGQLCWQAMIDEALK